MKIKYNVYDKRGNLLGQIWGDNPHEALDEAQLFDMEDAFRVVAADDDMESTPKYLTH